MAISCLDFNTIALFSRQIFKIDDAPVNASLIFWFRFAEMICSVPRNSRMGDYQNIWLTGEHSEPIGTIRTLACGPTQKSPPSVQAVFQVASAPISSRFLWPRPPLLLSAPNQNRHATQASTCPFAVMAERIKGQQWLLMSERLSCSCSGFCGTSEQEAAAHVTCRLADGNLERIRRLFSNL